MGYCRPSDAISSLGPGRKSNCRNRTVIEGPETDKLYPTGSYIEWEKGLPGGPNRIMENPGEGDIQKP